MSARASSMHNGNGGYGFNPLRPDFDAAVDECLETFEQVANALRLNPDRNTLKAFGSMLRTQPLISIQETTARLRADMATLEPSERSAPVKPGA
jgi:hypothetical protein